MDSIIIFLDNIDEPYSSVAKRLHYYYTNNLQYIPKELHNPENNKIYKENIFNIFNLQNKIKSGIYTECELDLYESLCIKVSNLCYISIDLLKLHIEQFYSNNKYII